VFKGFKDDVKQDVAAPYVICPIHNKQAWDEYLMNNPQTPGTENGGEEIDPAP